MKLTGKIISGKARGRGLGFPTLNVETQADVLKHGVYAVRADIADRSFNGVMNYGPRPTFDEDEAIMEIHIFEFDEDIYGDTVEIEVVERIRDIKKFAERNDLIEQIKTDIEVAKRILL